MEKRKMTKAEAFEYLKCTKVFCGDSPHEIQRKIFETGVEWFCGGTHLSNVPYLFVSIGGELTHCTDGDFFKKHDYEELSVDDILSIEIVDEEDNIAETRAFLQARDIMKWLRERQSPHTLMIIDGYHVELLDGVKSEVWEE